MSKSVVEFAVRAYFFLASIVCMVLVLKPQTLHIVSVPFSKVYEAANASHSCPAEPVCSCDSTPPVSVTSSGFDDEKQSMASNVSKTKHQATNAKHAVKHYPAV